jgi:N-acetylglucosaminyldiphosphoundecaprenol N-acetyl-beta-D-mannosaminyltransferase
MDVLNIQFNNITLTSLVDEIIFKIKNGEKITAAFSNPEFLIFAKKDKILTDYLNNVDYNLPDGIGVVLASKLLWKKPLIENNPYYFVSNHEQFEKI